MDELQINDVSNETGNIGQNDSADSLFQTSTATENTDNKGSLNLSFIDNAMTARSVIPSKYLMGMSRAASDGGGGGGSDSDSDSDGDSDSDDSGDTTSGETMSEALERSKREVNAANERTRAENAARDRARAERAKAEREAKEAREREKDMHSSGGETERDDTPTGGSGGGAGSGDGARESEWSNEADSAFGEARDATADANRQVEVADKAAEAWRNASAERQQIESDIKNNTQQLNDINAEVQKLQEQVNKLQPGIVERKKIADEARGKLVDSFDDILGGLIDTGSAHVDINPNVKTGETTVTIDSPTTFGGRDKIEVTVDRNGNITSYTVNGEEKDPTNLSDVQENAINLAANSQYNYSEAAIEQANIAEQAFKLQDQAEQLENQIKQQNQNLVAAQQAEKQALALANQEVSKLEALANAAQEALDRYENVSRNTVDETSATGARINDEEIPLSDPKDSDNAADTLKVSDEMWSREIKEVPDILKGTQLGEVMQEFLDIFNNYNSEINAGAYQSWWNSFMTYLKSIWGSANKQEGLISKIGRTVSGIWNGLKTVKDIFLGRTEGHITEFAKGLLGLMLKGAVVVMTGGQAIPAITTVNIIKGLWKSLKNDVVDSDLNQILENPNSEGGEYEYYDVYKAVADDADSKWSIPSDFGENYVAGKRQGSYGDYNYGLEGEDEQKGQLYSDEEIKDYIHRVYRKSPTLYKIGK